MTKRPVGFLTQVAWLAGVSSSRRHLSPTFSKAWFGNELFAFSQKITFAMPTNSNTQNFDLSQRLATLQLSVSSLDKTHTDNRSGWF